MRTSVVSGFVFLLVGVAVPVRGAAQTAVPFERNIDIQAYRPAPGPNNFLSVEGARVGGHLGISAGLQANYSNGPFVIFNAECTSPQNDSNCRLTSVRATPVAHMFTTNLLATLTLVDRIQIGIDIPIGLSVGHVVDPVDLAPTGTRSAFAISDPRLEVKARFVGTGMRGIAVGASAFFQVPIGRYVANDAFLGDASVAFGGRIIADYRTGPIAIGVNVGVLGRPQTLRVMNTYYGTRLTWGVAASFDATPRISALLEFFGSTDFANVGSREQTAIEGLLAGQYRQGGLSITLGGGTGLVRGIGAPNARILLGLAYAPSGVDADHDGVSEDKDRCPTEAEDRDGFNDADGCPDPDNDEDTLLDEADRCPTEAEDLDHVQDEDGCPDNDNDNDGVADGYDGCINEPEDLDGDRDTDGCPDDDRDHDGMPDATDRCPAAAEDTDGFDDEDGCPDPDNDEDGVEDSADQCPSLRRSTGSRTKTGVPIESPIAITMDSPTNAMRAQRRPKRMTDKRTRMGAPKRVVRS